MKLSLLSLTAVAAASEEQSTGESAPGIYLKGEYFAGTDKGEPATSRTYNTNSDMLFAAADGAGSVIEEKSNCECRNNIECLVRCSDQVVRGQVVTSGSGIAEVRVLCLLKGGVTGPTKESNDRSDDPIGGRRANAFPIDDFEDNDTPSRAVQDSIDVPASIEQGKVAEIIKISLTDASACTSRLPEGTLGYFFLQGTPNASTVMGSGSEYCWGVFPDTQIVGSTAETFSKNAQGVQCRSAMASNLESGAMGGRACSFAAVVLATLVYA